MKDLTKIYLSIINESSNDELGDKFINYVKDQLDELKSGVDKQKTKTCAAFGSSLNAILPYILDKCSYKKKLKKLVDDAGETLYLTIVGFYDTGPTNLANLIASIKKTDKVSEKDKEACKNETGFYRIDKRHNDRIIAFNFEKYNEATIADIFNEMIEEVINEN